MDPRNPTAVASAYREAFFENAPPLKIVHLMYEGALRFLAQAERLDPRTHEHQFRDRLQRAEAVVCELRLSLDPERSPDLATQLGSLYDFVESQLRRAALDRTPDPLPAARRILETLLDAWKRIELEASGEAA